MRRFVLPLWLITFALPGWVMAGYLDYAIFSTDDVTLDSYSAVGGHVYSGRDLTLAFFYGGQRPTLTSGSMYAGRDIAGGLMVRVNGDMYANQNVSLDAATEIDGNVTYGNTITYDNRDDIFGDVIYSPNSVPSVSLPPSTNFTYGTVDVSSDTTQHIYPGSYRNVVQGGLFEELHLYSGDYYMRSLQVNGSADIYLHMEGGPINIFSAYDIYMDSGTDFYVNGERVIDSNVNLNRDLAHDVFFETHGDFTIDSGFLSYFYGTIFAPDGNVVLDLEDMYGSIISGRPVTAEVYLDHYAPNYLVGPAIPEPSALAALLGMAMTGLVLGHFRGRRKAA